MPSKRYLEYLESPEWENKRDAALARACYSCERCGIQYSLQVHHKTYEHLFNELPEELEVLCADCHFVETIY